MDGLYTANHCQSRSGTPFTSSNTRGTHTPQHLHNAVLNAKNHAIHQICDIEHCSGTELLQGKQLGASYAYSALSVSTVTVPDDFRAYTSDWTLGCECKG
jgi:hypothetical protein